MSQIKTRTPTFQSTRNQKSEPTAEPITSQTETETPEAPVAGASLTDGSHLDGFVIPENDEASLDPDAPQEVDAEGQVMASEDFTPDRLDQAAFYTTLKTLLMLPGQFDADFAPVAVQSFEEDQARAASDSIYSLLVIWYPAALQPNSETIGHLLVAVPFIAGKVMVVRSVLAQKRAKVVSPPIEPEKPSEAPDAPTEPPEKGSNVTAMGVIQ